MRKICLSNWFEKPSESNCNDRSLCLESSHVKSLYAFDLQKQKLFIRKALKIDLFVHVVFSHNYFQIQCPETWQSFLLYFTTKATSSLQVEKASTEIQWKKVPDQKKEKHHNVKVFLAYVNPLAETGKSATITMVHLFQQHI